MSDTYGCYRCGFNHDRDQGCAEARDERHRAYAEECKRIVSLSRDAADPRPAEETEDAQ